MITQRLWLLGAVLAWFLPGCMVEQRDFEALRTQVRLQQKQINDLKARQDEQALRADTLNDGFKILGEKTEENSRRIDESLEKSAEASARTTNAPAPAAARNTAVPAPAPAPVSTQIAASSPVAPPPAAPSPAAPPPEPILITNLPKAEAPAPPAGGEIITAGPKAERLYAGALSLFSGRDYAQASLKFGEFVTAYADHKLAGNAQYWIGECYYSQKRFQEAVEEFDKVEKAYPTSPKVPAALLKKGLALWELKRLPEAQAALQRILDKYTQTDEATKAKEKLERWKQP